MKVKNLKKRRYRYRTRLPRQNVPPLEGGGLSQLRVERCTPPPQVREHVPIIHLRKLKFRNDVTTHYSSWAWSVKWLNQLTLAKIPSFRLRVRGFWHRVRDNCRSGTIDHDHKTFRPPMAYAVSDNPPVLHPKWCTTNACMVAVKTDI